MLADRFPVTDQGVVVPKAWLGAATEVEMRREHGHIVVFPLEAPVNERYSSATPADDPLWRFCDNPVDLEITDASVNLDKYLYGESP